MYISTLTNITLNESIKEVVVASCSGTIRCKKLFKEAITSQLVLTNNSAAVIQCPSQASLSDLMFHNLDIKSRISVKLLRPCAIYGLVSNA